MQIFTKKVPKNLANSKKSITFAAAFGKKLATVAQLVEQRIRNAWVGGSSPPSGSEKGKSLRILPFLFLFHMIRKRHFQGVFYITICFVRI